jgi:hypothetical protein
MFISVIYKRQYVNQENTKSSPPCFPSAFLRKQEEGWGQCLFFTFSTSKKHNQSRNFFDMSIEEMMQIEVTASIAQEKNHA